MLLIHVFPTQFFVPFPVLLDIRLFVTFTFSKAKCRNSDLGWDRIPFLCVANRGETHTWRVGWWFFVHPIFIKLMHTSQIRSFLQV